MKSRFDFGFDGGVEVSEGIVAVGIEVALLFDVILVVLLAYLVDAEQNVDHAHFFFFFWSPPLFFGFSWRDRESSRMNRLRGKRIKKERSFFRIGGCCSCHCVCLLLSVSRDFRTKCEVERREWFREERERTAWTKMIFWRVQRPVCPTFPILL